VCVFVCVCVIWHVSHTRFQFICNALLSFAARIQLSGFSIALVFYLSFVSNGCFFALYHALDSIRCHNFPQAIVQIIFFEMKKKDFVIMCIHHVSTIVLILGSFYYR
jgi:hypothetical protein